MKQWTVFCVNSEYEASFQLVEATTARIAAEKVVDLFKSELMVRGVLEGTPSIVRINLPAFD